MTSFRNHMKRKKRRQMISNVMKHCLQPLTVVSLCTSVMMYLTNPVRLVSDTRIYVHEKYPEAVAENDMEQEKSNEVLVNLDNASKGIISKTVCLNINESKPFNDELFSLSDDYEINIIDTSDYLLGYFDVYKFRELTTKDVTYLEDRTSVTSSGDEDLYIIDECVMETTVKERITAMEEMIPETRPEDIVINVQNISVKSGATEDMIECAFKGTWLEGYGSLYYELEQEYGINAFIAAANAIQETGWDITKSNKAMNHNNIYGIVNGDYDSIEECIRYYFDLMSRNYVNKGYKSLQAINTKYCPPDDSWSGDIGAIAKVLNNKVITTF